MVAVVVHTDGAAGLEIVAAPARVSDDGMSGEKLCKQREDQELHHGGVKMKIDNVEYVIKAFHRLLEGCGSCMLSFEREK